MAKNRQNLAEGLVIISHRNVAEPLAIGLMKEYQIHGSFVGLDNGQAIHLDLYNKTCRVIN